MSGRIRVAPAEERTLDGIVFHSKREMQRYAQLKLLVRAGIIHELERQVPFTILINGHLICVWKCDFRYRDQSGRTVVEDVKGMRTEVYKLKKKLVEAQYGVRILET